MKAKNSQPIIGIVTVSDRAFAGTYEDKGTYFLVPQEQRTLRERLVPHDTLLVDPDELVNADNPAWEWNEEQNFS